MKRHRPPARRDSCRRDRPGRTAAPAAARFRAGHSRGVEACRRAAEIDDDEKERRERIEAEIRADAGQPEREGSASRAAPAQQMPQRRAKAHQRGQPDSRHRPRRSRRTTGPPRRPPPRSRAGRPRTKVRHRPAFFRKSRSRHRPKSLRRRPGGLIEAKKHGSANDFNKERSPPTICRQGPRGCYAT